MDWKKLFNARKEEKVVYDISRKPAHKPPNASASAQGGRMWIGPGSHRTVHGMVLPGMFYMGVHCNIPCVIDPSLPVENKSPFPAETGHNPLYSAIGAAHRYHYLKWHASGRAKADVPTGYAFLHFYTLERRLLMGNPGPQEQGLLTDELRRMNRLFAEHKSFVRYSTSLLDEVGYREVIAGRLPSVSPVRRQGIPLYIRLIIARKMSRNIALNFEHAMAGFLALPAEIFNKFRFRPSIREEEIASLSNVCRDAFRHSFPQGLMLNGNGLPRLPAHSYKHAMAGLRVPVATHEEGLPDPQFADWNIMAEFVRTMLASIRKKGPARTVHPPVTAGLTAWIKGIEEAGGNTDSSLLLKRLFGTSSVTRPALNKAADALYTRGYGMEPDYLQTGILGPKDKCFIFKLNAGSVRSALPDPNYMLLLLCYHITGERDDSIKILEEIFRPEPDVVTRIEKCRTWWGDNRGGRIRILCKSIKTAGHAQRAGELLLSCVAKAGWLAQDTERMDTAWGMLGLGSSWSRIHETMSSVGAAPDTVTVRDGTGSGSWKIPPPDIITVEAPSVPIISLNEELLQKIRKETAESTEILRVVWEEDEETTKPVISSTAFPGLSQVHADILAAIRASGSMSTEDFNSLCKASSLYSAGVVESLNEWGFENTGDIVVEETENEVVFIPF